MQKSIKVSHGSQDFAANNVNKNKTTRQHYRSGDSQGVPMQHNILGENEEKCEALPAHSRGNFSWSRPQCILATVGWKGCSKFVRSQTQHAFQECTVMNFIYFLDLFIYKPPKYMSVPIQYVQCVPKCVCCYRETCNAVVFFTGLKCKVLKNNFSSMTDGSDGE